MTDQLRFNAGKIPMHYILSSSRAISIMEEVYYVPYVGVLPDLDEVVKWAEAALDRRLSLEDVGYALTDLLHETNAHVGEPAAVSDAGRYAFISNHVAAWRGYGTICEFGAKKYARGNYRKGAPITNYLDSFARHIIFGPMRGEEFDPESGLPHRQHAQWNLFQALDQPEWRDDRLPAIQYVCHPATTLQEAA